VSAELNTGQVPTPSINPQNSAPRETRTTAVTLGTAPAGSPAHLAPQNPVPPSPAPSVAQVQQPAPASTLGSFKIETEDEAGNSIQTSTSTPAPDPSNKQARVLAFLIDPKGPQPPPKQQLELQVKIEQVLHAARTVYPAQNANAESKFRLQFVSLFNAARWGLEGTVATDQAMAEVQRIEQDLIDDAAGPIKNTHLLTLSKWAGLLSLPFLLVYLVVRLSPSQSLVTHLHALGIDRDAFSNFMLLWIGCFLGVCLSYALRTGVPVLSDLTTTDKDYLRPGTRLVFAGTLTMLLALFSVVGLVDLMIGRFALSQVATNPILAFVIGAVCGISELALPASVGKKAGDLIAKVR
jgi:hypothetical protein